jgi:hypothetical protein
MQSSEFDLWEQLSQQHPQCRQLLLQIVGLAYEEERNDQLLPFEGDFNLLKPAVTTKLIQVDSAGVHFIDPTIRERATAQYLIEQSLLGAWEDADRFTRSLQRLRKEDLAETILIEIHNKYNHDVVARLAEDIPQGHFWFLCHLVFKLLPKLSLETKSLVSALSKIQEAASGDMADHIIYRGVQALAEAQPTLAMSLIEEISHEPSAPITAFIPPLLKGVSRSSFIYSFKHAINLSSSEHLNFQRAAIVTLSTLDYSDAQLKERKQVLELFSALLQSDSDEILAAIAFGYQQILRSEKGPAANALLVLSSRNSSTIQFSVSKALFVYAREYGREEWFLKALFNLSSVDDSLGGIIRNIMFILQNLLEESPQGVLDFFERWACCHDVHARQHENDSFKHFESIASSLAASHRHSLEKAITRWFASDKRQLHRLAARLVHIATQGVGNPKQPRFIELDSELIEKVGRTNLPTILHRILGHVFSAGGLGGLIFSALSMAPKDRATRMFVIEAFCDYVIYNFPSLLDTFILDKMRSGQPFERSAAREIRKRIKIYRQARENRPKLKELHAHPRAIRLARAKRKKMNEVIERGIEEHSVLLQLITRVTLKAGTSWFSEVNGHFTDKSNLGHFSQQVELPTGEIIDPVGQFRLRVAWLQEEEGSN